MLDSSARGYGIKKETEAHRMSRLHERFCLHRQRKIALGVCIFFAYLFVSQIVRLVRPTRAIPLVHGNPFVPTLTILGGVICAVGIFLEVKCRPERVVLILVLVESASAIVAIFIASPLTITVYRAISTSARFACAVITGSFVFRSAEDGAPNN